MPDFAYQVLIRLAVMLPTILITATLVWVLFRKFGSVTPATPLNPRDMRSWPLSFVLADSALFAVIFAVVVAWLGQGEWSAAIAGGAAAVVAIVLGGTQALSRSLFSLMIPKGHEAAYFSLYEIGDKGTSWMGPALFALVRNQTHSYRSAILSLPILFIIGMVFLVFVNVKKAAAEARGAAT